MDVQSKQEMYNKRENECNAYINKNTTNIRKIDNNCTIQEKINVQRKTIEVYQKRDSYCTTKDNKYKTKGHQM